MSFVIEIATSDYSTTAAAVAGGADRIELCANLVEGGTTPSYGTIKECREAFTLPVFPIIRPRGGDFLYSDEEFNCMLADVALCKSLSCDGVVSGMLLPDGNIDIKRTTQLVNAAYPMQVTFHRAFDRCSDPFKALEQLIEAGCSRILTSGRVEHAPGGVQLIKELQQTANGRMIIMPGSGVRKDNIKMLAEATGCTEFHSSLRSKAPSLMQYRNADFAKSEGEYFNNSIDPEEVKALRAALA